MEQRRQRESRKSHVFTKCWNDAMILGNWQVKGRRWSQIPAVHLIFSSILHLLPLSLVSFPFLYRVTVSDGIGLTGRRRSKKTVTLSSALEAICDMCTQTHTHSQTFLSGCHWRHQRVDALTQHGGEEIRSQHTDTHTYCKYTHINSRIIHKLLWPGI